MEKLIIPETSIRMLTEASVFADSLYCSAVANDGIVIVTNEGGKTTMTTEEASKIQDYLDEAYSIISQVIKRARESEKETSDK